MKFERLRKNFGGSKINLRELRKREKEIFSER